ncbi:MAG: TonB-dependent receptor [Caldimonas sp.]
MIAFGSGIAALPAVAQQQAPDQQLERVEITGSAIKRIDAETAVPVTILRMDDLKKEGVTTVEQILVRVSANQSQQGTSQSVGLGTGGASFADLRGLGQNKTLVLLNGRRLANNAIDGSAPDLNIIPFAAIDRVEVLRDGASALYGTDAIGGVINFITRKTLVGGSVTVGFDSPQQPGGKQETANAAFGFGDLDRDKYNFLAALDYQHQQPISASQRAFGSTGNLPNNGIAKSSGSSNPANYTQGANGSNPALPGCNSNPYIFGTASTSSCREDFTKFVDLIPRDLRMSGLVNGTIKLSPDTQLDLSYFATRLVNNTNIAPVPFSALTMNPGTPFFPGNGITPAPTNFVIDPTMPIGVRWRDAANGPRAQQDTNIQQRFLVALEGNVAGWDYNTGVTYNTNKVYSDLTGGYADGPTITNGVADGTINPFGAQNAAGQAAIDTAGQLGRGNLEFGSAQTTSVDARASRELGDWMKAGRPAALAVGAEFRHEQLAFAANPVFAQAVVSSTGVDPSTNQKGSRNIEAAYTELNVPVLKTLDVTGAVRFDKYSDFGNTTNPKVSFRYQPAQQVLIRGAYSTGFRAPSLYELDNPTTYTNTANAWNDPLNCPNGVGINGFNTADVCNTQFIVLNGGNKKLQPEKARNATLGVVFEPVADASLEFDFWWVKLKNQISVLPDTLIFGDPAKYAGLFHRAPNTSLSIDGSQCPGANCGYITDTSDNLGDVNSNGVDISLNYRLRGGEYGNFKFGFNGTYVTKYEYQPGQGGAFLQNVGIYSGTGPIFRWQHNLTVDWTRGAWGAGIINHYKSDYYDQNDPNQVADPSFYDRVQSYSTWDFYGTWAPIKSVSLLVGIRNAFDRSPPFSNQGSTFQTGYDPRFTDPTGRTYYMRGTYSF